MAKTRTVSAAITANQRTGGEAAWIISKGSVRAVERNLSPINTQRPGIVKSTGVKAVIPDGEADVYNMEVADNHNYAVNGGLILHNCDSARYFVKTMKIACPRYQYTNNILR